MRGVEEVASMLRERCPDLRVHASIRSPMATSARPTSPMTSGSSESPSTPRRPRAYAARRACWPR